jgi:hypothetical protein
MQARAIIIRTTVILLLAARGRAVACRRDESMPEGSPVALRAVAPAPAAVARAAIVQPAPADPAIIAGVPALTFVRYDIDSSPFEQVTEGINVGDIDGDGRPDLVVGGDQYLLWYHNPDWAPNLIASGFKFAGGAMVVLRDMDGDGRLDVLTGRYPITDSSQRQTVWYGNTPSGWVPTSATSTATGGSTSSPAVRGTGTRATAASFVSRTRRSPTTRIASSTTTPR